MPYDWYLKGDKRDFFFRTAAGLDFAKTYATGISPWNLYYFVQRMMTMMERLTISIWENR
jgi:hypothetical protein